MKSKSSYKSNFKNNINEKKKEPWEMTKEEYARYIWNEKWLDQLTEEQWIEEFNIKKPKSGFIKVYRGFWQPEREHLAEGDWVTLDRGHAKYYAGGKEYKGKVLSKEIPINELVIMQTSSPGMSELVWKPQVKAEFQEKGQYELFEEHHKNQILRALKEGKRIPQKVLKQYPEFQKLI